MRFLKALGIAFFAAVLFWLLSLSVLMIAYGMQANDWFARVIGLGLAAYLAREAFLFLQHVRRGG